MKKKSIIMLLILGLIILILGIILLTKNNIIKKQQQIKIIDTTYFCNDEKEMFYQDNKHTYYFPCKKSDSIYVKLENGNKMLIVDALNSEQVTINELIDAGLEVQTKDK